jgi:hypothetical protein
MYIMILVTMGLLGAGVGGVLAWRNATETLSHSIDVASAPKGVRGRDYRRGVRHQRKRRRLAVTLAGTVGGAALGVGAAFAIALLQAVR